MASVISSFRDVRHIDKTFYLGSDARFYEPNYVHYVPNDDLRSIVQPFLQDSPVEWMIHRADVWTHIIPDTDDSVYKLPSQGWKAHISATNLNCKAILEAVAKLAISFCIQFKFANDVDTLRLMTSKRWARGGSGKFITVYPASDQQFRAFMEAAYRVLKGHVGSFILSDRRYRDSRCLYYRYGGMKSVRQLDHIGRRLETLTAPDGRQIVDQRMPYFDMPDWVTDPFSEHDVDEDEGSEPTLGDGRYLIQKAISFSNTGGVYLATDLTRGMDVLIKEARPYVELSSVGEDATDRLAHEARLLKAASGLGVVPEVYDTFWDWENFYLVEEFIDAEDMRGIMLSGTPLLKVAPTIRNSEDFYKTYTSMFVSLLSALDRLHNCGIVIGDLSPTNILVEKGSMRVHIIDLEGAFRPNVDGVQDIHTPGFRPQTKGKKKASDFSDDLYAVGVIMMYSIFPIAAMNYLRADLFSTVLPVIIADVGWSKTPVLRVIQRLVTNTISSREAIDQLRREATIQPPQTHTAQSRAIPPLDALCGEMARFITGNFRLDQAYTLFPVDPFGRHNNPLGFGFGSSGVIYAMNRLGHSVPEQATRRYYEELQEANLDNMAPGFLTGTAGIAMALLFSGQIDEGRRYLAHANSSNLVRAHHSLYYGMAGIGMANLAAYHILGDSIYLDQAVCLAETLEQSAVSCDRGVYWQDNGKIEIGCGYGQSGVALFLLRLSQVLNDPRWRAVGRKALDYDLSHAQEIEPGVVSFGGSPDNSQTLEQYIEQGSGGIAKVAIRYGLLDDIAPLLADVYRKYSGFPGLIYGLSGFLDTFTDAHIHSGDPKYREMALRPLQGLIDLYVFETEGGQATPGENLFRISCDYATGMAGIVTALNRHAHERGDEMWLDWLDDASKRSR